MPTPTIAPPPDPEKDTRSVSDSALTATDWVVFSEVLSFTTAASSIKARLFDFVVWAIIVPCTEATPAPPAVNAPDPTVSAVRERIRVSPSTFTFAFVPI